MWCGLVWFGLVWCGVVWCGVVYCDVVWFVVVWFGVEFAVMSCNVAWYGLCCGVVWSLIQGVSVVLCSKVYRSILLKLKVVRCSFASFDSMVYLFDSIRQDNTQACLLFNSPNLI